MAEEQRFESPEDHRLCANNCGFFGITSTMNLCSKCFADHQQQQQQQSSSSSLCNSSSSSSSSSSSMITTNLISICEESPANSPIGEESAAISPICGSGRCSKCRKKVGLIGFRCRCGTTFCGTHRYPESHGCRFDFKRVGRDEIRRANPIVKAIKLHNKI